MGKFHSNSKLSINSNIEGSSGTILSPVNPDTVFSKHQAEIEQAFQTGSIPSAFVLQQTIRRKLSSSVFLREQNIEMCRRFGGH